MQNFFNKITYSINKAKEKPKEKENFDFDTYNNLLDECTTKEKKLNIIKLKQIAIYYDRYFPNELDSNYLNKNNIELRDYLIKFFCINKKNLFMLYNKINNIRAVNIKKRTEKKIDYIELNKILSDCSTKKWSTNLLILKRIARYYDDLFPNELDHNYLEFDNITLKAYLSNFFCKNKNKLISLYNITNNDNIPLIYEKEEQLNPKKPSPKDKKQDVKEVPVVVNKKDKIGKDTKIAPIPIEDIKIDKGVVIEVKKEDKKKKQDFKDIKEIKLNIKKIDGNYLADVKKEYTDLDSKDFTIKSFQEDIMKDVFIMNLIESQKKALEYKYQNYMKLNEQTFSENLQIKIQEMIVLISELITTLNSQEGIIEYTRNQLLILLNDPNNGFASITGTSREIIKIALIKLIYIFIKNPIVFFKSFNNYALTGQLGSYKSSIVKVLTNMFSILYVILSSNLILANKYNLNDVDNTRNLLEQGLEGVIFIDEVHTISNCKKDSDANFTEIINELIRYIDKFMGCIIIIVAGNKEKLQECFFKLNEDLSIRFPRNYDLPPYTSNDIYDIFENYINGLFNYNNDVSVDKRKFIKEMIVSLNNKNAFNYQSIDMMTLSNLIAEDFSLYDNKYTQNEIKLTFKRFMINKNLMIEFL